MERRRARAYGIAIGDIPTGHHNAITDVPGVRVGHATLREGDGPLRIGEGPIRTGVTAIVPPGEDWWSHPVEAAQFTWNGSGTTAGLSCIDEYERIETPICLTNTLSVGTVYEGIVRYMVEHVFKEKGNVPWFNPIVGETSDAFLNDIGGLHVRPEHAVEAIRSASGGPVEEGAVGGGLGMSCLGWKGGIGTSSRVVDVEGETGIVGVLVQSNFGGLLTIDGVQMPDLSPEQEDAVDGSSIMMIVATDLPLSGHLLQRAARRATFGLARTGSRGGHGSGDYVIALSTTYRNDDRAVLRDAFMRSRGLIDHVFPSVADATEEAILNSMFMATRVVGRDGNTREALPIGQVVERLEARG